MAIHHPAHHRHAFSIGMLLLSAVLLTGFYMSCTTAHSEPKGIEPRSTPGTKNTTKVGFVYPTQKVALPALPTQPSAKAGGAFWKRWGDGKAELSGYKGKTPRYGQMRPATTVLVYVTEPMRRETRIKDDNAQGTSKLNTMKLNHILKFRTGLYPYSVMTSVFSPVDRYLNEAFDPIKISLTAQEWCGHVFQSLWPAKDRYLNQMHSYFAGENDALSQTKVAAGTLYEDALFIQLRELDVPFNQGKSWSGSLVPTLWLHRRIHQAVRPVEATITRRRIKKNGQDVHEFTIKVGRISRIMEVEAQGAKRILGWKTSDGESFTLQKTARLPYWSLHNNGDESYLKQLGL